MKPLTEIRRLPSTNSRGLHQLGLGTHEAFERGIAGGWTTNMSRLKSR
ncbi:hypothetical protein [Flavobacterium sp.]